MREPKGLTGWAAVPVFLAAGLSFFSVGASGATLATREAKAARPIHEFFATNRLTQCWYLATTAPCQ